MIPMSPLLWCRGSSLVSRKVRWKAFTPPRRYRSGSAYCEQARLRAREQDFSGYFWFRDQHRRRLIVSMRRTVQRYFGNSGLRIADVVDRVLFDLLIEHTLVR